MKDTKLFYPLDGMWNNNKRAVKTWEWRGPKEWERFLSWASPKAYKAVADMQEPYYIVRIVNVVVKFVEQVETID